MEEKGDIDCWVMALPNGVCAPYVDAIEQVGNNESLVIDLSADFRFQGEKGWVYGLPELVPRSEIAQARRISNPGCYGMFYLHCDLDLASSVNPWH